MSLKKSQSVALPLATAADEDTPMKANNEDPELKEVPIVIDLNATVNEIDEGRGFATPGDSTVKTGKKSQRKVPI